MEKRKAAPKLTPAARKVLRKYGIPAAAVLAWRLDQERLTLVKKSGEKISLAVNDDIG